MSEQTSTFVDTAASASDLSMKDIAENVGVLAVLGAIWLACILLWIYVSSVDPEYTIEGDHLSRTRVGCGRTAGTGGYKRRTISFQQSGTNIWKQS